MNNITVKKVMKVLSFAVTFLFFMPSCLVSCEGEDIGLSAFNATVGVSRTIWGQTQPIVEPHIIMAVALIIPLAIVALLFVKKFEDKLNAMIIAGLSVADLIIAFAFVTVVKNEVSGGYSYGFEFKTTFWHFLNIISLLGLTALAVMVIINKLEFETDLLNYAKNIDTSKTLGQIESGLSNLAGKVTNTIEKSANARPVPKNVVGYCTECGQPLQQDTKFCPNCGKPVNTNQN